MQGALAAEPSVSTAMRGDALTLIAPGNCWSDAAHDLTAALSHCARIGADVAALSVQADPAFGARACAGEGVCASLADALVVAPAPRLLLRVPVALLDDVQRIVERASANGRTLIEPLTQRPSRSAAAVTLAPGLTYRREYRETPRRMMIHIVEADLSRTGTDFVVTPGQPQGADQFVAEKTTDFARRLQTAVAVNATYFRPFDGGRLLAKPYVPAIGQGVVVDGVSIANGHVDAPAANADPRSEGAFCVSGSSPAGVAIVRGECAPGTSQAVGAGPVLLLSGQRQALSGEAGGTARAVPAGIASITPAEVPAYYRDPQPRTAIGLDAAALRMWFVVVDGRQSGYSEGIPLPELASLFIALGAHSALNLDGGGSSTLVLGMPDGTERLTNTPIHTGIPGRERPVANHLGLRLSGPMSAR